MSIYSSASLPYLCAAAITSASKHLKVIIVRLDRTIQTELKRLDSPIKSGNDVSQNSTAYLPP
jgi:hypothetical protein